MGRQTCLLRHLGASFPAHKSVEAHGQPTFRFAGIFGVKPFRHNQAEHAVAEKLQPLVGFTADAGMGESTGQQAGIGEAMA
jgi:hypothetical protein